MGHLLNALISGLASATPMFLTAAGLTMIYGVMRVLNFAHGSFFMIGAYVVAEVLEQKTHGFWLFMGAAVLAGIVVAVVAVIAEEAVFKRLDRSDHLVSLLASYALSLIIAGGMIQIFGPAAKIQPQTPLLNGAWQPGGILIAHNDVFMLAIGLVVGAAVWLLMNKTPFGYQAVAVADDHEMAAGLGVRVKWIAAGVFAVGGFLAGLAGGLVSPEYAIAPGLDSLFLLQSFAVVIVGGLGSIGGSFGASVLLGVITGIVDQYAPSLAGYSFYISMALVLMIRPQGLAFARKPRGWSKEVAS